MTSGFSVSWPDMKAFMDQRKIACQWISLSGAYQIVAIDGDFGLNCVLPQDGSSDVTDFETKYKPAGNLRLTPQLDSDNASFSRTKQAPTGWTYQLRGLEIQTSNPASLVNVDPFGVQQSDTTIMLYDATGALTTTPTLATRTVVDFEPHYDFYIIGGLAKILVTPTTDVRISVIAVPDVPFSYGGSRGCKRWRAIRLTLEPI